MVLPKMTVAQKREFLVEMCNCREYLKTDVELNKAVLKKHLKFLPQQKLYKFRACIEREFRMLEENSKALLRQLSRVISDAKVMVDSPERAKDMEMLFGVMPICVLTGQLDVMREVLEAESGISSAVKAEAERYLKDE